MPGFVIYDAVGQVKSACRYSNSAAASDVMSSNTPAGMTAMAVPDTHDALVHPNRWKVVSGVLTQKVRLTLSLAGLTLSSSPAADASIVIGSPSNTVTLAAGLLALASAAAPGKMIMVDPSDPNYYSEPMFS